MMLWIESLAALLGVLSVYLMTRQRPIAWPIGLVMVLLYSWVFFVARLYSEMLLQLIYAVLQLYGWWQWWRKPIGQPSLSVSFLPRLLLLRDLFIGLAITLSLGFFMSHYTQANVPWLDAALTGFSLVGQYWMAHKRIQCWWMWLVLNIIYVVMFIWVELYVTAALYVVFIGLAIYGWQQWRKALVQPA